MQDKKIIGVIPARYQSSRLPGKPLRDIHGKPMIYWVAKRVEDSDLEEYYVATDDDRIFDERVHTAGNVFRKQFKTDVFNKQLE